MRYLLLFLPALLLTAQTPASTKNFKESGSPTAPISIEIYTDYQCPHCRELYLTVLPPLIADFVRTGKVRLLHRDFPLPQFQYSRLAARFANAAGRLGEYDLVANQLFQTQPEWSQNGNVDGAVAKVLPPGDMQKVREMVKSDTSLEADIAKDVAMGYKDNLMSTPTIVIVARGGKREVINGGMPYPILKTYLDQLLAH